MRPWTDNEMTNAFRGDNLIGLEDGPPSYDETQSNDELPSYHQITNTSANRSSDPNLPQYETGNLNAETTFSEVLIKMKSVTEGMISRRNEHRRRITEMYKGESTFRTTEQDGSWIAHNNRLEDGDLAKHKCDIGQAMWIWNRMRFPYLHRIMSTTEGWSSYLDSRLFTYECWRRMTATNSLEEIVRQLGLIENMGRSINLSPHADNTMTRI